MVMNPLGPLVEKASELSNAGANLIAASKEFGGMALGATVEFTKETTISAGDKSLEAVSTLMHLGHSALGAATDASKVGLSIPGATVNKFEEVGKTLIGFSARLLPSLGDRPKDKE